MTLGGAVVWAFDRYAWRKYYEGKRERDTITKQEERRGRI